MFIIAGQRLCGRVDEVPGTCYVVTRFMHLYYVPLIPLSSWLVPYDSAKKSAMTGVRIRLSPKSVLVGWLQGFLAVFGLINLCWGTFRMYAPRAAVLNHSEAMFGLLLGVASLVALLMFTLMPLRAGHERANQLRSQLGLEVEAEEERFEFPGELARPTIRVRKSGG